jgi:hypothetical protein
MKLYKTVESLCSPSRFYLGLSIFAMLLLLVQNFVNGDINELCVGSFKCNFPHVILLFVFQILYVSFWTWFLNYLCKKGLKTLSWFIVLIPFLLSALSLAIIIYNSMISAPHSSKQ